MKGRVLATEISKMKKQHFKFFFVSVTCSVISSISLLASSLVNNDDKYKGILITFGILFWLGFVLEQVFFWKANKVMKIAIRKEKCHLEDRLGIISFFAYIEAIITDTVFIVSLIAFIICMIVGIGEQLIQYILICLIVLSFRLHCFLNGRNYKYIKKEGRA